MSNFVLKRKEFYWLEKIYTHIVIALLPTIGETKLTPNMITQLNIINSLIIFGLIWSEKFIVAAILVQLYLFLDILDGNLARYKKLTTRLGKILDQLSDIVFYNLFYIFLGFKLGMHWAWVLLYLLIQNLYGIVATYVIVPRIRKLPQYQRWGLKKWLMKKGIILGMDMSTQSCITSLLLLTRYKRLIIYSITILYFVDLVLRLIELKKNIRLYGNMVGI